MCQRLLARRGARGDRGAAALEFALVSLPLLLLVFGIISFGFMLSFRQGLSQAAAEGARAAAVSFADSERTASAQAAVSDALSGQGITCTGGRLVDGAATVGTCVVTEHSCAGTSGATCVTVTLDYSYRDHPQIPSAPIVEQTIPQNLTYAATARVS